MLMLKSLKTSINNSLDLIKWVFTKGKINDISSTKIQTSIRYHPFVSAISSFVALFLFLLLYQ